MSDGYFWDLKAMQAQEYVRRVKVLFGNTPTWGMVEQAFKAGIFYGSQQGHSEQPTPVPETTETKTVLPEQ